MMMHYCLQAMYYGSKSIDYHCGVLVPRILLNNTVLVKSKTVIINNNKTTTTNRKTKQNKTKQTKKATPAKPANHEASVTLFVLMEGGGEGGECRIGVDEPMVCVCVCVWGGG